MQQFNSCLVCPTFGLTIELGYRVSSRPVEMKKDRTHSGACNLNVRKTVEFNLNVSNSMHIFKTDAEIRNTFLTFVCDTALPQTRRLLLKMGRLLTRISRFLPKSAGCVCTHLI